MLVVKKGTLLNNKLIVYGLFVFCFLLLFLCNVWGANYTIKKITDNDYQNIEPKISEGKVVITGLIFKFIFIMAQTLVKLAIIILAKL